MHRPKQETQKMVPRFDHKLLLFLYYRGNILLVFSGLVFEIIDCLPEESDTEKTAVVVFNNHPGGGQKRK